MKWFLFFTMFFCSVGQAQNIYFSEPTSTHVDYIGTGGSGPIAYNMYAANGWVIYHYWARLTYPDGSQTDWMYGETGGWWVTKAGTYQIEGKASGESIFGGGVVMLYRWPFSFNVVDNYSPSAPQNLQVSKSSNNRPQLTWTLNSELDMSHYIIYKKITEEWGWQYLATTTSNSYEDVTETYLIGPAQANEHNIYYRITAQDINSHESTPSSIVTARVAGLPLDKKGFGENFTDKPTEYLLHQNYPNPFNPVTSIHYQLPMSGLVQIKVYDLLGIEVATLIKEYKSEGVYTISFDASYLPSGVYIYSLSVNDFVQNNKMTLLK